MFIGSLLPAAVAAWRPRRPEALPQSPTAWPRTVSAARPGASHNVAMADAEARSALGALSGLATDRFIELQLACEPQLPALAEPGELQLCLRDLLAAAISRAQSGVLVTGAQRGDLIEIAILDDGCTPAESWPTDPAPNYALPAGTSVTAEHRVDRGTTVVLRMPSARGAAVEPVEDAADTLAL